MNGYSSRRQFVVALGAVVVPLLAGCHGGQADVVARVGTSLGVESGTRAETTRVSQAPRWAVFGLDCSDSYDMAESAKAMFANSLRQEAKPGDTYYFRTIVADSYSDPAALLTARFPKPPDEPANPFDAKWKARVRARQQEFVNARETAARKLEAFRARDLPVADRQFSDIYGFISKSGELLAKAPEGADKFLAVATDLRDNRHHRNLVIDLKDVHVIVAFFQNKGKPEQLQALRQFWIAEFTRFGAASIEFRDPSETSGAGFLSLPVKQEKATS